MEALAERLPATQEIDKQLRISTDTATWLAETLHGSMRTNFEFAFDGAELRGEDGGSLDEIFDDAISEAKAMTEWNPSLLFELRRRLIEREELDDMYEMVKGNKANTMIVISDFPPELMDANEDVGGYNVSRQQTMMRIISLGKDGKLSITSQSLDGSNRQALEAIYAALGEPVQEGELLGQRISRDLPEEWQSNIADNLTKVYDASLVEQKGGEWHAGISQRPDRNMVNTYDFVLQQRDLIEWFTGLKLADPARAEKHRYNLAATAQARHAKYIQRQDTTELRTGNLQPESFISIENIVNNRSLTVELNREGMRAARRGRVFSGCGSSVKAENEFDELTTADSFEGLGYGNKAGSDKYGSLSFDCPKGHKNTRPRNKLIDKCQKCGTSVKC